MDSVDITQILQFNPVERAKFDNEQKIYSLVKTIEYLNWAFTSGKIEGKDYD